MAKKYCVHWDGVTSAYQYCGDGTTNASAASAGAAGAWNDLEDALRGVPDYGTLDAGDILVIKSCDSDTGDFNLKSGTITNPIQYVVDDGDEWANTGTVECQTNTYNVEFNFSHYTAFYGNMRFYVSNPYTGNTPIETYIGRALVDGVIFDLDTETTASKSGQHVQLQSDLGAFSVLQNSKIIKRVGGDITPVIATHSQGTGTSHIRNIEYDLTAVAASDPAITLFGSTNSYGYDKSTIFVDGVRITGARTKDQLIDIAQIHDGEFHFRNISCNEDVVLDIDGSVFSPYYRRMAGKICISKGDSGKADVNVITPYGQSKWDDDNYPYLNATLRTGDGWSKRISPMNCEPSYPLECFRTDKLWNGATDQVKVTVDLLADEGMSDVDDHHIWVDLSYFDSSGNIQFASTLIGPSELDALSTSTASWSKTAYGAVNYDKFKIEVTTPTAVKQNTNINITLTTAIKTSVTDEYLFVDPDPVLEAV